MWAAAPPRTSTSKPVLAREKQLKLHTGSLANKPPSRQRSQRRASASRRLLTDLAAVFPKPESTLTRKKESTTHVRIKTPYDACAAARRHHHGTQQFPQEELVSFASFSTISGTFNSLFKVLFTFPSRYLFAIGLEPIFSFR